MNDYANLSADARAHGYFETADALDALVAENQQLHDALEKLEQEFVARGGLAASPEDVAMYLGIARAAWDVTP
jgi:hypothetical protein